MVYVITAITYSFPSATMKILSSSERCHLGSPQARSFIAFAIVFCAALQYFHIVSAPDPSSFFFNVERGYQRRYSSIRIEEAESFIERSRETTTGNGNRNKASPFPSICVGVATVQRDDARYFDLLVGSLLDGLSDTDRSDILLLPFIANINPSAHYAFNQMWLSDLSDEVLTYANVSAKDRARMRSWESPKGHKKKALFDYAYTLQSCFNSSAPYILMLEDDVIAADGWYPRTKAALEDLENQEKYANSIYLRLFYNTRLQGWNSELWPQYLFCSVVFEMLLFGVLWTLYHSNATIAKFLTPRTTSTILLVCSPACVALYFAAGRLTVNPNPLGIHQMNSYGCCSQALVFPRAQVPPLLEYFQRRKTGLRDVLIETYANRNGLTRWALTPSVFQHIGSRSSKWKGVGSDIVDRHGLIATERIWNYHFEDWDADRLRSERRAD